MSPSANMFFERSPSRRVRSNSLSASSVSEVSGTGSHLVLGERVVLERVRRISGLLEIAVVEGVRVHDHGRALRQVPQVRLQRRRIHRDEHVGRVAGREDVVVGEVDLEPGHARQRTRGRADLGREVGQRREVVPEERRLAGEAPAGELHPVSRVAREANHDPFLLLDRFGHDCEV